MRQARLAGFYLVQVLKTRMAYRVDFFIQCLSALSTQAVGLITIVVIFDNTRALGEWSQTQVLFIYGMSMLVTGLFGGISYSFWHFANRYIMEGEFDRLLMRPVNPLLQLVLENVTVERLPSAAVGVIVVWLAGADLGIAWSLSNLCFMVLFTVGGVLVLCGLFLAITTTSFWFEDRAGLVGPVYNLMAFGKYPLTIFSNAVQVVLSFVLPFGFMAFYPATHFLRQGRGSNEFALFCYATPLVGLLVFSLGYGVWTIGVRSYRSTGS